MDPAHKSDILNELMIAVSPAVTKYSLETLRLFRQCAYAVETPFEHKQQAAQIISELTVEIATQLVERFATIRDASLALEAQEKAQGLRAMAEGASEAVKQTPRNPITELLSQPSGVSSEALAVRAVRRDRNRGPS